MLEFSSNFFLAVGKKRGLNLLDGWSALIFPIPLWGPQIQTVTGQLEVCTFIKSFEDIL